MLQALASHCLSPEPLHRPPAVAVRDELLSLAREHTAAARAADTPERPLAGQPFHRPAGCLLAAGLTNLAEHRLTGCGSVGTHLITKCMRVLGIESAWVGMRPRQTCMTLHLRPAGRRLKSRGQEGKQQAAVRHQPMWS